jgi:hypothetical protein
LGKRFELNPTQSLSPENNREPEQDDCDRYEWRAGDVSNQDEDGRDDGEDDCDAVVHRFSIVGVPTLPREVIWTKVCPRSLLRVAFFKRVWNQLQPSIAPRTYCLCGDICS